MGFRFIYDDHSQIENNPHIQSIEYLGRLLTEPLWAQLGPNRASHYYRPVFSLMLVSQYLLFGPHPAGWHAVSLGLHIGAVLSVFVLLVLLFGEVLPAFLGSLVFAVMPANAEVVSFLGAADDSFFAMLLILSLCALIGSDRVTSSKQRAWLCLASGLLFQVCVFTKETAVGAGMILISYQLIAAGRTQRQEERARMLSACLVYLVPVTVYWTARSFVFHGTRAAVQQRGIESVLSLVPRLAMMTLRQLTWPRTNSILYDVTSAPNKLAIVAAVILIAATVIGFFALLRKAPLLAWAVTLLILPVAPWGFGLFYMSEYALFQNRYLYLSSAAVAVLVAYGFTKIKDWPGPRWVSVAATILICAALAAKAHTASLPYHDDLTLFRNAVEVAPNNVVAVGLLADAEAHAGNSDVALGLYERAVSLRPELWTPQFNLAMAYSRQGSRDKASETLARCVALPDLSTNQRALGWYELGMIKASKNELAGAEAAFRQAESQQPTSRRVHVQLIRLLEMEGRGDEAAVEKRRLEGSRTRDEQNPM